MTWLKGSIVTYFNSSCSLCALLSLPARVASVACKRLLFAWCSSARCLPNSPADGDRRPIRVGSLHQFTQSATGSFFQRVYPHNPTNSLLTDATQKGGTEDVITTALGSAMAIDTVQGSGDVWSSTAKSDSGDACNSVRLHLSGMYSSFGFASTATKSDSGDAKESVAPFGRTEILTAAHVGGNKIGLGGRVGKLLAPFGRANIFRVGHVGGYEVGLGARVSDLMAPFGRTDLATIRYIGRHEVGLGRRVGKISTSNVVSRIRPHAGGLRSSRSGGHVLGKFGERSVPRIVIVTPKAEPGN